MRGRGPRGVRAVFLSPIAYCLLKGGWAVEVTTITAGAVQVPRRHSQVSLAWQRYCKNKLAVAGLIWVAIFLLIGIIGPWIAPYNYATTDFLAANQPPTALHPFGTDSLGHDMLSEILWSVQNALEIAFGATLVSFVIGT